MSNLQTPVNQNVNYFLKLEIYQFTSQQSIKQNLKMLANSITQALLSLVNNLLLTILKQCLLIFFIFSEFFKSPY